MLTASAFLFLVLNLIPSPTLRSLHTPTACFAVAAAVDAPTSLRGLQNINANNPNNANNPSFASLVWGNNQQQNATNANNAAGQATPVHASTTTTTDNTNGNNDDARDIIHLEMVNSSSWRDPAGVTFYEAEASR